MMILDVLCHMHESGRERRFKVGEVSNQRIVPIVNLIELGIYFRQGLRENVSRDFYLLVLKQVFKREKLVLKMFVKDADNGWEVSLVKCICCLDNNFLISFGRLEKANTSINILIAEMNNGKTHAPGFVRDNRRDKNSSTSALCETC